jgi:hypothetical protein
MTWELTRPAAAHLHQPRSDHQVRSRTGGGDHTEKGEG